MYNLKAAAVCLGALLSTAAIFAQVPSPTPNSDSQTGSPAAYVYVSTGPTSGGTDEIVAYSASPNGALSPIPGSPFQQNVYSMALNGKYLMGSNGSQKAEIDAFLIGSDGSLTFAAATDYAQYNNPSNPCGFAGHVFFDHTGSTLYLQEFDGSDACTNDVDASFAVDKATGRLIYLGTDVTGAFPGDYNAAYFTGNNIYAYSAADSACMYYNIYGFQRDNSGLLNDLNFQHNLPTPPPGVSGYVADLTAADPTNHLAMLEHPANPPGCAPGPLQLATYTVDGSGNINTTNTYRNMPATLIQSPNDMKMSPSGKLVAVAGQEGLQIFHFNGANPITHYTGLLTKDPINEMFWDNKNHLYAISGPSNKLFVFTITPTTHQMAPGSPHTVALPRNVIVQPLPRY